MKPGLHNHSESIILMADVVKSSRRDANALMKDFAETVEKVNGLNKKQILSPLTITLGDEFQGVIKSLEGALKIVLDLEELTLATRQSFRLRYVILEGEIQTPLNRQKAYGMLGPGLTEARQRLGNMKTGRGRFQVELRDAEKSEELNLLFVIFQGIRDQWTQAQMKIASAFLQLGDYRKVAEKIKRDPTATWRRRKSLMIDEFLAIKTLIMKLATR
jgi:hypothetical protein